MGKRNQERMMRMAMAALVLIALTGPAMAASFDCGKAKAADERAICSDRLLNDADVRMTTMLTIAEGFVGMGARGAMQDDQVEWLKARHGCGGDRGRLTKSYVVRIATLQKSLDFAKSHGPF